MNYLFSFFAGLIQGLTEFLPVSSSGHLVILHEVFGFNFADDIAFDVILHLGTMVAVIAFFYFDLIKYLKAWLSSVVKPNLKNDENQRLAWLIFLAAIPAGLVGLLAEDQIETFFRSPIVVGGAMVGVGIILFFADHLASLSKPLNKINFVDSLAIGLAQVLSLIPGVSRSGITIIAGLSRKLNRKDAAYFSFLVSAPLILGAGLKKSLDLIDLNLANSDIISLLIGFSVSAISGYMCIKYFLKFLEKNSLKFFAYYRITLGLLLLLYLFFK